MSLKKNRMIIMIMMFLMLSVLSPGISMWGETPDNDCKGPNLEEIYQAVSASPPTYILQEIPINFTNEGMNLVCSLVIPQSPQRCPVIVMLNGFTGNRNDGYIPGTGEQIWPRFSRLMAEHGIASLRVDFRGSGDSDGDYTMTTFSTQISDALAAVNHIDTQLKHLVDANAIGMFGYSQGGLVASAAGAVDKRVKSMVLWSPVANAPLCYEGLLTKQGLLNGLAIPDGSIITLGIYVDGQYAADITLGKGFIQDIFRIDPMTDIKAYANPLMVVVGTQDVIVWPQPEMGELFLKSHDGCEKLLVMDTDHFIGSWNGPETVDDAAYWATAWFIKTLKGNY